MAANTVNGSGNGARPGAQTLTLLAAPLNVSILRALAARPMQQIDLRRESGAPAPTTLRAQLKQLIDLGAVEKRHRNRFPGALEYELAAAGHSLLAVADVLEQWLGQAPEGPLTINGQAARAVVKALTEAWSATMLRALASGAFSLTDLDRMIGAFNYPSLERRLRSMRLAGLVEARSGDGRATPYTVTEWLRRGVAPLAAAIRWERRHLPQLIAPVGRIDAETLFLLAVPMLRLPERLSGTCRIAAELPGDQRKRLAGVMVELMDGRVAAYTTDLRGTPDAWAVGSTMAWIAAMLERDTDQLELGGDCGLAAALVEGLGETLPVKSEYGISP